MNPLKNIPTETLIQELSARKDVTRLIVDRSCESKGEDPMEYRDWFIGKYGLSVRQAEAARMLNVSENTISAMVKAGKLKGEKTGPATVLIDTNSIFDYKQKCQEKACPQAKG